jgi:hypothetical protein
VRGTLSLALAALALLLAWHAVRAVRTGVMPMRVSAARRGGRAKMFWAGVAIELVLAAAALTGAIVAGLA